MKKAKRELSKWAKKNNFNVEIGVGRKHYKVLANDTVVCVVNFNLSKIDLTFVKQQIRKFYHV